MTDDTRPQISDPTRAKVSLADQAEEAARELTMRYRVYPGLVAREKMTAEQKDAGIAAMRAIRDTLRLFAQFEPDIRALIAARLQRERDLAELDALADHPSVQAVQDAFPEALITDVRPLLTPHMTEAA